MMKTSKSCTRVSHTLKSTRCPPVGPPVIGTGTNFMPSVFVKALPGALRPGAGGAAGTATEGLADGAWVPAIPSMPPMMCHTPIIPMSS